MTNIAQEVQAWIANGCDYHAGIALYGKYGRDMRLKTVVFTPQNNQPVIVTRLKLELDRLLVELDAINPEKKKEDQDSQEETLMEASKMPNQKSQRKPHPQQKMPMESPKGKKKKR